MWVLSYFGFWCCLGSVSQSHPQTSSEKYTCTQTTSDMRWTLHLWQIDSPKCQKDMMFLHLQAVCMSLGYMLGVLFYNRSMELALTGRRHATGEVRNASHPLWRNPPEAFTFLKEKLLSFGLDPSYYISLTTLILSSSCVLKE